MKSYTRRDLLNLMGLGTSGLFLPSLLGDRAAQAADIPKRFFVYYTPHGPVQQNLTMRPSGPGGWNNDQSNKTDREMSLSFNLPDSEAMWSQILKPLFPHRKKTLVLEGLSMTSALLDKPTNNHNAGTSHALTGAKMVIPGGFKQEGGGGGSSIDQIIADKISDPAKIKSLFYTTGGWSPIFRGKAEQTGQASLSLSYDRLFPVSKTGDATADHIKSRRPHALELVTKEYNSLLPKLSGDDKAKLTSHYELIADVQKQINFRATANCASRPEANPQKPGLDHETVSDAFGSIIAPALACDMTRVAVFNNSGISQADAVKFLDVHTDLHLDVAHNATPRNATQMAKMAAYYTLLAKEFAAIVSRLDAIQIDGTKTLLDYTTCLWMCELANGPHDMHDVMAVVVGGGETGAMSLGRYVKYPENIDNPRGGTKVGPAHQKLLVSLMGAHGVTDTSIGMKNAELSATQRAKYDLEGALPMLKA